MQHCTLCGNLAQPFAQLDARDFFRCDTCQLTFADPATLPDPETEKAHYDHHNNAPGDAGYRRFLSQLADPLGERLKPGDCGLDFGCGPGPGLPVAPMIRSTTWTRHRWISNTTLSPARKWWSIYIAPNGNGSNSPGW